jgi:polyisoprenoid-binding protein YceI
MSNSNRRIRWTRGIATALLLLGTIPGAAAQELTLHLDPGQSNAAFTLGGTGHTVHGTFNLKSGEIHFDPATGKASGEIVFDATTGQTGNQSRDHKMHKDVLQSLQYPTVTFRPDHAEGTLVRQGDSTLQVHGLFGIHGSEHELTVPMQLNLTADKWNATGRFSVPYVTWGMKNPSVFFLKVGDTVDLELRFAGTTAGAK